MKQPTFPEGVAVALAASLAGAAVYTALDVAFPGVPVLRLLIAGIGIRSSEPWRWTNTVCLTISHLHDWHGL